jgi:hypothetical protein
LDAEGWMLGVALATTTLGTLVPILSDAGLTSQEPDREPDRQGDHPAARAERERATLHMLLDDLEPSEEEQEDEADVGENSMYASGFAMSSTSEPIRIPSTISTTTVGRTTRW